MCYYFENNPAAVAARQAELNKKAVGHALAYRTRSPSPSPPPTGARRFLHTLPLDILVLIARSLDNAALALLCQTCRTFRNCYHVLEPDADLRNPGNWSFLERRKFESSLVPKRELCADCRRVGGLHDQHAADRRKFLQAMHCSACRMDHPLVLFSAPQRSLPPNKRICRQHEAALPLCQHKSVRFRDFRRLIRWAVLQETFKTVNAVDTHCSHISHLVPTHRSQLFSPSAWVNRWRERPRLRVIKSAKVYKFWDGTLFVQISRARDLLALKPGEPLAVSRLRSALRDLDAEGSFKVCPHRRIDDLSISTCVPAQCPCLTTENGNIVLPNGLHAQQTFGQTGLEPYHIGDNWFFPKGGQAVQDYIKAAEQNPAANQPRQARHTSLRKCCLSTVDIYCDCGNPRVIRISYQARLKLSNIDHLRLSSWCSFADPLSFGVPDDPEMEHIFWCREPSCARFYCQPSIHLQYEFAVSQYVHARQHCACKVPFWAMSRSEYDLRYDPGREEKNLDYDTYYDKPCESSISWRMSKKGGVETGMVWKKTKKNKKK